MKYVYGFIWNLMKQSVTVGAQLLWGGRYGCNNGRYGYTIVMSYIEINKAVSQWLLTFNLCVSVTWPYTCAFHIPCTHTPEIIDMHRGVCDYNDTDICVTRPQWVKQWQIVHTSDLIITILTRENGKLKTLGLIYCMKYNLDNSLHLRHTLDTICPANILFVIICFCISHNRVE